MASIGADDYPLLPMSQLRSWTDVTFTITTTLDGVPLRNVEVYDMSQTSQTQDHQHLHIVRRKTKRNC